MHIDRIDHLVLTVADVEATCAFYAKLGMEVREFAGGFAAGPNDGAQRASRRKALHFGGHKINLHAKGHEFEPKAKLPTPGSADFCLTTSVPIDAVVMHLEAQGIAIEVGPSPRDGARAKLRSIYLRDPDGNLVEISNEQQD